MSRLQENGRFSMGFISRDIRMADFWGCLKEGLSKVYGPDASILRVATVSYSIRNGAGGSPALFRQINGGTPRELVESIEDMQILYGVDTDTGSTAPGFGTPNYYVDASFPLPLPFETG